MVVFCDKSPCHWQLKPPRCLFILNCGQPASSAWETFKKTEALISRPGLEFPYLRESPLLCHWGPRPGECHPDPSPSPLACFGFQLGSCPQQGRESHASSLLQLRKERFLSGGTFGMSSEVCKRERGWVSFWLEEIILGAFSGLVKQL